MGCDRVQKNGCFSITIAGFSQKVTIFRVLMCLAAAGYLSPPLLGGWEGASPQYVADRSHHCLCCSLLSAQVKPQGCPLMAAVQRPSVSDLRLTSLFVLRK